MSKNPNKLQIKLPENLDLSCVKYNIYCGSLGPQEYKIGKDIREEIKLAIDKHIMNVEKLKKQIEIVYMYFNYIYINNYLIIKNKKLLKDLLFIIYNKQYINYI